MRREKACSLCFQKIDNSDKFNVFKHNSVIVDKNPQDKWFFFSKHYVCSKCMKKLQNYCQEGMFQNADK